MASSAKSILDTSICDALLLRPQNPEKNRASLYIRLRRIKAEQIKSGVERHRINPPHRRRASTVLFRPGGCSACGGQDSAGTVLKTWVLRRLRAIIHRRLCRLASKGLWPKVVDGRSAIYNFLLRGNPTPPQAGKLRRMKI